MSKELEEVLSLSDRIKVCNDLFLSSNRTNRVIDEEGARILKQVRETGSIREAAKKVGRDYRAIWMKINGMEKACGMELVERSLGGVGGGYAKLTFAGEFLLRKYDTAKRKIGMLTSSPEILKPDLTIIGSHCPALEILIGILEEEGLLVEYMHAGSLIGMEMVYRGLADISGIHLFDDAGEYNNFVLRDMRYRGKLAIIKGYIRRQGLIVKKGNPKGIRSFGDILGKNVTLVNRNRGSGTRLLTDHLLGRLAGEGDAGFIELTHRIKGYGNEARSHSEVVTMIKHGKADVGIGLQASAYKNGLDFIPLRDEGFDFVIRRENLGNDKIRKFIGKLKSKEFRMRLSEGQRGIFLHKNTGRVLVHG